MTIRPTLAVSCAALMLGACSAAQPAGSLAAPSVDRSAHPEATAFTTTADTDAMADVDAALLRAAAADKRVLVVMGANWCHDSRALAGWLETPRFAAMTEQPYEIVYVNVGMPQTGDTANLAIAQRFGIGTLEGTPTMLVLASDGTLINPDSAKTWRNAASRSEQDIFDELVFLATAPPPDADAATTSPAG